MQIPTEIKEKIKDKEWRLNHLYKIKDKHGEIMTFKMNKHQRKFWENIHQRNIIPKARQLGFSTFSVILFLDSIIFSPNKKATIVTKDESSARELFRDKLLFALEKLPSWLRYAIGELDRQTQTMIVLKNGSTFQISNSTRSGTVNYLHISELGPIDKSAPLKSEEIIKGSLNTTHTSDDSSNIVIIESTAMGKGGNFYRLSMSAEALRVEIEDKRKRGEYAELSPQDYKIHFSPWWTADEYTDESDKDISDATKSYFRGIESEINNEENNNTIKFTDGQMRWWQQKKHEQGDMSFEYPSTLAEAFTSKAVGVIYKQEMKQLMEDFRYRPVIYNDKYYVDTYWDLGVSDDGVVIFTQTIDSIIYIIDIEIANGKGMDYYARILESKGYRYRTHHLPWDGEKRDVGSAKTPKKLLQELGVHNIKISPKIAVADGINNTRSIFKRIVINEFKCGKLKESLLNYRFQFNKTLGEFTGQPVHDKNSHAADALRTMGVMWKDYNATVILNQEEFANDVISDDIYEGF